MNVLLASALRRLVVIAGVLLLSPCLSWAWGCTGHEVIALVAREQMNGEMRQKVDHVLGLVAKDYAGRYCSEADLPLLAYFATWADDYRGKHPETAEWHYWDIPLNQADARNGDDCDQGCVVQAIHDQISLMKDPTKPQDERLHALMFLTHFVGDVHQPLHAEDNMDRGGNCVPTSFLEKPTTPQIQQGRPTGNYSPNLHSVWDTNIVEYLGEVQTRNQSSIEAFARRLNHRFSSKMSSWKRQKDPAGWALESHQIARSMVYRRLPTPIAPVDYSHPVKDCNEGAASERYFELHEVIDRRYLRAVRTTVERRLAAAGARLAMVLEDNWPADWN